jgi:cytochrome c oxidase subunit 1
MIMVKKSAFLLYLAMVVNAIVLVFVSAHRAFIIGLNPFLGLIFLLLSLLVGIPLAIFVGRKLVRYLKSKGWMDPATAFALGAFCLLIGDLIDRLVFGQSTLDIQVHDTLFVIAHSHLDLFSALLCFLFAAVYADYPRVTGRRLNEPMGYIHFFATLVAAYAVRWSFHYEGLAGMPRRYIDYNGWIDMSRYEWMSSFAGWVVVLFGCCQLLFVFNLVYSAVRGRRF